MLVYMYYAIAVVCKIPVILKFVEPIYNTLDVHLRQMVRLSLHKQVNQLLLTTVNRLLIMNFVFGDELMIMMMMMIFLHGILDLVMLQLLNFFFRGKEAQVLFVFFDSEVKNL